MCDCKKKPEIEESICKLDFVTGSLVKALREAEIGLPSEDYLTGAVLVASEALGELWKVIEGK